MDLQLNLTDLSPDVVSRILAFVSEQVKPKADPLERPSDRPSPLNSVGVQEVVAWAKERGASFRYSDVAEAFPSTTEPSLRKFINYAYQMGAIDRLMQGTYQIAK